MFVGFPDVELMFLGLVCGLWVVFMTQGCALGVILGCEFGVGFWFSGSCRVDII